MQPIQVGLLVKEVLKLLNASLPATIEIKKAVLSDAKIMGDPTQIHQIIMNLCTNSAHAMEEKGGRLSVELRDIEVDKGFASKFINMKTGPYLHLTVADTGHGISKVDLEKIFEPFFTTKPEGKGTGLGLSLVHGIIKNHKGQIAVKSEPGKGTSFDVYLPVLDSGLDRFAPKDLSEKISRGDEKILIVDDEEAIIKITQRNLADYGYSADGVTDPFQAVDIFERSPFTYDMVITDMTMPGLTGDILAEKLTQIRHGLPVVLVTGFSNKIDTGGKPPKGIKKILLKPVVKSDLLHAVRQIFDRGD